LSLNWPLITGLVVNVLLWILVFRVRMRSRTGNLIAAARRLQEEIDVREGFERALKESEQRLAMALSAAGLGLWDRDIPSGRLVFDHQWTGMLGYAIEDIEPHFTAWEALIHPDDLPDVRSRTKELHEGRADSYRGEFRLRGKSGEWRWILSLGRPISWDADGKPLRVIGTHQDITERKRIEQALRDSEARFRLLFEKMRSGFSLHEIICDENGTPCDYRFLEVNPAFEKLTGLKADQIVGKTVKEVLPQTEDYWIEVFGKVALTGEPAQLEQYSRAFDRYYEVMGYSPRKGQFAAVFNDVTDRHRAEEERRRIESGIQHAQKLESLGVLAGGIAHDFNNLLMGILGNANLALGVLPKESPIRSDLEEIETAGRRAADLCRQMLAYSGKGKFEIKPLDLNGVVEEISHLLEVSISKQAVLKYHLSDNLPTVEADGTQLRQVVMNLITNASEAIGDQSGIIRVATGARECSRKYLLQTFPGKDLPAGLYVYLEVTDTGCGMTREIRDRIFEPFFTTKFTGRGLGLAAVLGIVRGHRGTVHLQTESGRGTCFRVYLPPCDQPAASEHPSPLDTAQLQTKGKVLLIDDDETVRSVGRRMLEKMGVTVITADDGRHGVEVFKKNMQDVSCVLLDLTMPHMNGEEAYKELRRLKPDVKVILSSGYSETEIATRFAGMGLAGYLHKPYDKATLREAISVALQNGDDQSL